MVLREDETVVGYIFTFSSGCSTVFGNSLNPFAFSLFPALQNRLREALVLYHSIITSKVFINVPAILFLNKADLLRRKCRLVPENAQQSIKTHFPEFQGDASDWKLVFRFIEKMFLGSHLEADVKDLKIRSKKIYAHMVSQ